MEHGTIAGPAPARFHVGMRVTAVSSKYPGNGTVNKVNPRTIDVTLDSGKRVRFDRTFLVPEGTEPTDIVRIVGSMAGPQAVPALPTGTFVRYTGPTDPRLTGVWVVIGDQNDKTRIARPNGTDDGRYWRIPNGQLKKVTCTVTEVGYDD